MLLDILKKHREIIAYVICGTATTMVSIITYYLITKFVFNVESALQLQIANIISWVISVLFAFVTNKMFVFKSKASAKKEIIRFYIARIATLIIDMALMYALVTVCCFDNMISKCAVQIVIIILNYIFGKKVFSKN